MNEMNDDRNELELNAEQRMQALLCAYVLGEASAAERAEVEAALEKSAELRAERARLEATIPVVSEVLKERAGEALSPSSAASLEAAAARRSRPSFFQQPIVRMAAGLALVVGAYAVYRDRFVTSPPAGKRTEGDLAVANATRGQDESKQRGELAEDDAGRNSSRDGALEAVPSSREAATAPPSQSQSAPVEDATVPAVEAAAEEPQDENAVEFDLDGEKLDLAVRQLEEAKRAGEITGETLSKLDAQWRASGSKDLVVVDALGQLSADNKSVSLLTQSATPPDSSALSTGVGGRFVAPETHSGPAVAAGGAEAPAGPASPGPATTAGVRVRASKPAARGSGLVELGYSDGSSPREYREPVLYDAEVSNEREALRRAAGEDSHSDDFYLGRGEGDRFGKRRQLGEQDLLRQRYERIHYDCRLPIGPIRPRDMFFRYWGDNPFELSVLDRQSTFSADVDTASYTLARRYLVDGHLPGKEQIRTEEFVNYFKGDVPPPTEGTFAVATELAPSLFGDSSDTWMMRVAIRGKEVAKSERLPVALTFVVDVSGSMREGNRLELVKHSLRLLVSQMDANDSISLIKFSNDAALLLPMTSARHKDLIESAIHPLQPNGSTNTEAGLRMGYEQALAGLTPNANNRVVLLTDGVANVGITDPNALVQMVERQRTAGIYLNTVGVGMNNHNDNLLEQLADKGDGLCNYVDDAQEVKRALVDNFTGAFQAIARDVKIQVEFDPAQIERYRLLGYENRAIADADFRNDKVDAGEIGAGHQVVALYEVVRRNGSGDGPLATVRLRWKPPYVAGAPESEQGAAHEVAHDVHARSAAGSYAATSAGYRRAVLVAQFAEFLRRSVHSRRDSLDRLIDEARKLSSELKDKEFDEFVDMAARSRDLIQAELMRRDWLDDCGDLLRHRHYLHCQVEELRKRFPTRVAESRELGQLEQQLRELEIRLEELRQRVESDRGAADAEMVKRLEAENIALQRKLLEVLDEMRRSEERK